MSGYSADYQRLRQLIEQTPADAKVKGMFIESFMNSLTRERIPRPSTKRFVAFSDYCLRDWMLMMLESTELLYPRLQPQVGLRRVGQLAYPTLVNSTVGKIIFSLAGRSWKDALSLSSRAYAVSLTPGSANLVHVGDHDAILELRDVWNFADCYQVGVMEGAMEAFNIEGTVEARRCSRPCDVDLIMRWL